MSRSRPDVFSTQHQARMVAATDLLDKMRKPQVECKLFDVHGVINERVNNKSNLQWDFPDNFRVEQTSSNAAYYDYHASLAQHQASLDGVLHNLRRCLAYTHTWRFTDLAVIYRIELSGKQKEAYAAVQNRLLILGFHFYGVSPDETTLAGEDMIGYGFEDPGDAARFISIMS